MILGVTLIQAHVEFHMSACICACICKFKTDVTLGLRLLKARVKFHMSACNCVRKIQNRCDPGCAVTKSTRYMSGSVQ